MLFCDISPFARYVRDLVITKNSTFSEVLPIDCRLFYVKSGVGKIKVRGTALTLPVGSALYINSFVPYTLLKSDVTYIAINFDFTQNHTALSAPIPPVVSKERKSHSPLEHIKFDDVPAFNQYLFCQQAFSLYPMFQRAEEYFTKKPPFAAMSNRCTVTEILLSMLKSSMAPKKEQKGFNGEEIAEYIKNHLTENISNSTLGEKFHFHKNYLGNQFALHFGKSLHSYILEMRILKAVALLESGGKSITEIAAAVGFKDVNYFSRYFKKITGASPTAYINNKYKKG